MKVHQTIVALCIYFVRITYSTCSVERYQRTTEALADVRCTVKYFSDQQYQLDCGMLCQTDLGHCCHAFGAQGDQCAVCSQWDKGRCYAQHSGPAGLPPFDLYLLLSR